MTHTVKGYAIVVNVPDIKKHVYRLLSQASSETEGKRLPRKRRNYVLTPGATNITEAYAQNTVL